MSDPYRGTDLATLQDDVRCLREKLEGEQVCLLEGVRKLRVAVLCGVFPVVVILLPLLVGILLNREASLQREVNVLHIGQIRQDAQIEEKTAEIRRLWQVAAEEVCQCPRDIGEGEEEWKCIDWRSW